MLTDTEKLLLSYRCDSCQTSGDGSAASWPQSCKPRGTLARGDWFQKCRCGWFFFFKPWYFHKSMIFKMLLLLIKVNNKNFSFSLCLFLCFWLCLCLYVSFSVCLWLSLWVSSSKSVINRHFTASSLLFLVCR